MRDLELTPDERECLLRGDPPCGASDGASEPPPKTAEPTPERDHQDASVDHPLEAELRHALTNLFQDFGMRLATTLSQRARTAVDVQIVALEEPSYGEFVFSLDQPTCFQVIQAPPLSSPLLMELNPTLLFPLLDRLLGGGKLPAPVVRRALTEIEWRLVTRISEHILEQWVAAWRPAVPVNMRLKSMESNPKLVRSAHPGTPMLAVKYEVSWGDNRGHLWAAIAQSTLVEVRSALLHAPTHEAGKPDQPAGSRTAKLTVSLAESTLKREELLDLRVGDIIATEATPNEPATLYRDGRPTWRVFCGTHGGKKAVRIESQLDLPGESRPVQRLS